MKKILSFLLFASAILHMPFSATGQKAKSASLQSWRDARFGMFIHWGPVSITEKEISWSRANTNPKCPNNGETPAAVYDNLYKQFNPVKFNAKEWVATAKAAGVKYMILTAKHCDGFLLWDSKVDDYNIMHTPFKRDVCAELSKAAHQAGMKIGWYFSPMDWRDPDCRNEKNAEFVKRMQAELTELLTNYGKIDILWFDTDGKPAVWDQETTYKLVRGLQPDIVINERLDLGENGWNEGRIGPNADFHTPEQTVGGFDRRPWESCMTLSKKSQWAWGGHSDGVKPASQCLDMLIRCAGGDGNMLLNVGPMPDGEFAPEQTAVLMEMGKWLKKNGKTIYGTRGGPWKPGNYGTSTCSGNTVWIHCLSRKSGTIELPSIPAKILKSKALNGAKISVNQTDKLLTISFPKEMGDLRDLIVELELDRPAFNIEPIESKMPSGALSAGKRATASNVYRNMPLYDAAKAADDDEETRWATDNGTHAAWLEIDLGEPCLISRAALQQAFPELKRIRKFTVEAYLNNTWKPVYTGSDPGSELEMKFSPVTAQRVRLNILEATEGPTIWEFRVFR